MNVFKLENAVDVVTNNKTVSFLKLNMTDIVTSIELFPGDTLHIMNNDTIFRVKSKDGNNWTISSNKILFVRDEDGKPLVSFGE